MIKSAEVLKGLNTTALQKVSEVLQNPDTEINNELEFYAWLHRLEDWAATAKKNIRTAANTAFTALKTSQPDKKTWDVSTFALVTTAARPVSYTYPPEVVELDTKAKAAIAKAKEDGTAKKATGDLDPSAQVIFKIELKEV